MGVDASHISPALHFCISLEPARSQAKYSYFCSHFSHNKMTPSSKSYHIVLCGTSRMGKMNPHGSNLCGRDSAREVGAWITFPPCTVTLRYLCSPGSGKKMMMSVPWSIYPTTVYGACCVLSLWWALTVCC